MGDMANGGAPRTKDIVARLNEIAGAISNGQMNALLLDGSGVEIGTAGNPLIVDIGGDVPDTLDLVQIAGTATAVGAGVANTGTIRVVNASDDVNLSGILAQLDITLSALRDALRGTGSKDFTTLEADAESILAQLDVDLSTRASEATLAAQLDITLSALRDALRGVGVKDLSTIQAAIDAIALDAVSLPEIKAATEATRTSVEALTADVAALKSRADNAATPVVTPATGAGAIAVSYAPGAAFWLDAVTVRLSADPTTSENLDVVLDTADGSDYDITLWSVDPSASTGSKTDFYFVPAHPILCAAGDAITVSFPNTDAATYGVRIVARLA